MNKRRSDVSRVWCGMVGLWSAADWWPFYSRVDTLCTERFSIQKFYVLPTHCIYVFCVDLRTNSDYFPTQH